MKKIILTISFLLIGFFALGQRAEACNGTQKTINFTFHTIDLFTEEETDCDFTLTFCWECSPTNAGLLLEVVDSWQNCSKVIGFGGFADQAIEAMIASIALEAPCIPPCGANHVYTRVGWAYCQKMELTWDDAWTFRIHYTDCDATSKCYKEYDICYNPGSVTVNPTGQYSVGTQGCPTDYIDVAEILYERILNYPLEPWQSNCYKSGPCNFTY